MRAGSMVVLHTLQEYLKERMAGRMGNDRTTVLNLEVMKFLLKRILLL